MELEYHSAVTCEAIGEHFDQTALNQIIEANFSQDSGLNQLRLEIHFDNNLIPKSLAYIYAEHARIVALAAQPAGGPAQRAALGRLCHTVQDFYSHSNYVDLWLAANGGLATTTPADIDGLDDTLLNHPDLITGNFYLWRDLVFHIPGIRHIARRIYIPPGSHEAMNLDTPAKGPHFAYSLVAACQRTRHEYRRASKAVLAAGGQTALARFQHTS